MLYEINEKVIALRRQGKSIINFNVGDPDQATPPAIIQAAYDAMAAGHTKYGSSAGAMPLRERLAERYAVDPATVIVTPGSKWAIYSIIHLLLKDGGNLVVPSPHWSSYELIARDVGAELRLLKGDLDSQWAIDIEALQRLLDDETRLIILNNPNNPTSNVLDPQNVQALVDVANERQIPILSDETYADISFTPVKNILQYAGNHIFVNSFSKTFAMTGWRIGFAILDAALVEKLVTFNQISISNVPLFLQDAAVKALDLIDDVSHTMREIYRRRAEVACTLLANTRLRFTKPDAPFYLFPRCDVDAEEFAFDLLDRGVAVVPGTAFGDYNHHFRISLTTPDDAIQRGLETIAAAFS